MLDSIKNLVRKLMRVPPGCSIGSWMASENAKFFLRVNLSAHWPVHPTSRVVAGERVRLGFESYPGDMPGCYIQANNGIVIGNGCQFGPGVGLISANHLPHDLTDHDSDPPIRLGDRCWLGMNAIILPGVHLGDHTIVGAGAVVTKSFPEGYVMIAGNPAKEMYRLDRETLKRSNPDLKP